MPPARLPAVALNELAFPAAPHFMPDSLARREPPHKAPSAFLIHLSVYFCVFQCETYSITLNPSFFRFPSNFSDLSVSSS